MAWQDSLLPASYRGVPFEVVGVSRAGGRAIARYEYPYTAGADLEDLNLGPRVVRVRAIFWGDDYETQLAAFINAVESPGSGELVHPVHGSMTVMPESWSDDHDAENVDSASVEVMFVEDATYAVVFSATSGAAKTDAIAAGADDARAAADDALEAHVSKVPSTGLLRITSLKAAFDKAKAALTKLMSATTSAKLLLSDLDPLLYPRAYANDLLSIVDRGLQGLPFGGRNLLFGGTTSTPGSGMSDFTTARRLLDPANVVIAPGTDTPDAAMLTDASVVQAHSRIHAAAGIAEAAAIVLAGEMEEALLERSEIEALMNQARASLQVAIDSARACLDPEGRSGTATSLRTLAYSIEEAARAVINQRPPLVHKPAPVSGPVRLVAHALYGDASRAPEIARLNRLGRNVFVEAGEDLNVYAA